MDHRKDHPLLVTWSKPEATRAIPKQEAAVVAELRAFLRRARFGLPSPRSRTGDLTFCGPSTAAVQPRLLFLRTQPTPYRRTSGARWIFSPPWKRRQPLGRGTADMKGALPLWPAPWWTWPSESALRRQSHSGRRHRRGNGKPGRPSPDSLRLRGPMPPSSGSRRTTGSPSDTRVRMAGRRIHRAGRARQAPGGRDQCDLGGRLFVRPGPRWSLGPEFKKRRDPIPASVINMGR